MTRSDGAATFPPPDPERVQAAVAAMRRRRARLRRNRLLGVSYAAFAAVIIVVAVAASSPGHHTVVVNGQSTTTTSTARAPSSSIAPISRSSIVKIELFPNPEGPVGEFSATLHPAAYQAALDHLPGTLPAPSGQQTCDLGRSIVITTRDGQQLHYGSCIIPGVVNQAIDAALSAENGRVIDSTPQINAIDACRTNAPTGTLLLAEATTVGDVRHPNPAAGQQPIADAFSGTPDTAFAAWCERSLSDGHDQFYAVGPRGAVAIAGGG
jgi:hypothetical protein